jgi:hypothetical protein
LPAPFNVIAQAFADWWDELFGMAVISVAWLLCWLTIILGPPATFGLYYYSNGLAHGKNLGFGGFVEGGRRFFLKSWLWMLLNLAAFVLISVNVMFYGQFDTLWALFLRGLMLVTTLTWLGTQFYALPYLMEQEKQQLRLALRNGLLTLLAAPMYSLIIVVVAAVLMALSLLLVFPLILGVPALISALGTRAVSERLDAFRVRERDET